MAILALVNRPLTPATSRLATLQDLARELEVGLPGGARLAGPSVSEQRSVIQGMLRTTLGDSFIKPNPMTSLSVEPASPSAQVFIQALSMDERELVTFAENVLDNINLLVGEHQDTLTEMINQANAIIAQMKEEGSPLAMTLPSFGLPTEYALAFIVDVVLCVKCPLAPISAPCPYV